MFCERCGAPLEEGSLFCESCGTPVEAAVAAEPTVSRAAEAVPPEPRPRPVAPAPTPAHAVVAEAPAATASRPRRQGGSGVAVIVLALLLIASVGVMAYLVAGGKVPWMSETGGGNPPKPPSGPGTGSLPADASYDDIVAALGSRDQVEMEYVSADVSDYPIVKAYFSIRTPSGSDVTLDNPVIAVKESVSGGEELAREVKSFGQLKGREGISFSLVTDKSGSMDVDLPEVRSILSEFVRALDMEHGDEAQLISFDSFVMYMCTYTRNENQLLTGISNMEPYGGTALYDALYDAVGNAGSRRGARCVIAFTDGGDNESSYDSYDVKRLAQSLSVPVYIIGTYGADSDTLGSLARATGGRYWDISSIRDMKDVLDEIAVEERQLYCVEYVSDSACPADAERSVSCGIADATRGCRKSVTFAPTAASTVAPHESRYELVQADISWTDANAEAIRRGGHLVTINSQEEMDRMSQMAQDAGLQFVWMGGYTSTRGGTVFGHWVTGEPFDYQSWYPGEPSRNDLDGAPEMYLILWRVKGVWSWNDERNAPYEEYEMRYMRGKLGYIIEYEDAA